MLVHIHFQKNNDYKFFESYYVYMGVWNRQKATAINGNLRRFKRKLSVKGH